MYITGIQVKLKTSMMIYDDSDVYMSGNTSRKHNTPKCRCNNNNSNKKSYLKTLLKLLTP